MTEQDRVFFGSQLALLAEVFGRSVTDAVAEVYFEILHPFDRATVAGACAVVLRTSRIFPAPVELLEACAAVRHERRTVMEMEARRRQLGEQAMTEQERTDMLRETRDVITTLERVMRPRDGDAR